MLGNVRTPRVQTDGPEFVAILGAWSGEPHAAHRSVRVTLNKLECRRRTSGILRRRSDNTEARSGTDAGASVLTGSSVYFGRPIQEYCHATETFW